MDKKWKLSVTPKDFVEDYSFQTLKYLEWLLTKFCTEAEISPYETIRYKLGSNNEDNLTPSSDIESKLMYMLEGYGLFEFDPNPFPGIQMITLAREGSHELIESIRETTKKEVDLKIRYEDGWLKNYKVSTFREWLNAVRQVLKENELSHGVVDAISNDNLLNSIPENKKTRYVRKMAEIFIDNMVASNFDLAKCIKPSLTNKKYKLSQKEYDREVQNKLRTLKKYWGKVGYTVKSIGDSYRLQPI